MTLRTLTLLLAAIVAAPAAEISVSGTRFLLDGKPFPYTGISFFNAIYNRAFNESSAHRAAWLEKFNQYGIHHVDRLKEIAAGADSKGMVIELALFCQESWRDGIRLAPEAADRAVAALAREMLPHRNVTFQVWNEFSERVLEHVKTFRSVDPKRLVTNSPGVAGVLGDPAQNAAVPIDNPIQAKRRLSAGRGEAKASPERGGVGGTGVDLCGNRPSLVTRTRRAAGPRGEERLLRHT